MSTILMRLVSAADAAQKAMEAASVSGANVHTSGPTPASIQYATMLISILPVLCVYPFVQKYFVKGVMLRAIKA